MPTIIKNLIFHMDTKFCTAELNGRNLLLIKQDTQFTCLMCSPTPSHTNLLFSQSLSSRTEIIVTC